MMKEEVFISIIAASSALLGALIPTVIGYINKQKQNQFELTKTLLERQKDIYWDLMVSLQNIINNTTNETFIELQKSVNKISVYGDNETSKALYQYYMELVKVSRQERINLSQSEHQRFQSEIVNGIRKNLGLNPFDNYRIVGFHP
ncbi:MAG: hypothetical protein Q7J86_15510 [Bacteroidota bacterium]|nr:hypothetical protein [Bacteroidota bacterium]